MTGGTRIFIGLGLLAAVSACAGRPDLPPEPAAYVAAGQLTPEQEAAIAASPAANWLSELGAEEMTTIAREALAASPDLQTVEARARAARWRAVGTAGSSLLPSLSVGVDGSRAEAPIAGTSDRTRTDSMGSLVSASWEIDLWGRLASRALAANLNAEASDEDFNAARLSIAGQAARGWVQLIEAQQLLALVREDLATRERALDFTQRRYESGVASSLALRTARSQVASARAFEAQSADSLLVTARRLQEVLGRYPDGSLRAQGALPQLAALSGAGAPEDLLERRPDVLAAEARMDAAGFRMHEARAAMLPRLTLRGTAGSSTGLPGGLDDIDDSINMASNVVAGLTMPIFQGGALFSESRASVADRRAAATQYVSTAISAWREVEAAISADASLAVREREFAIAAEEARAAQDLAEREYSRGVATIFELIDAYSRRIDAERGLIAARALRVTNRIDYHVALGGGARTGGLAPPEDGDDE